MNKVTLGFASCISRMAFDLEGGPKFKLRIRLMPSKEKVAKKEPPKTSKKTKKKKNKVEPYQQKTSIGTYNEKTQKKHKKQRRKKAKVRFPPIVIKPWTQHKKNS